MHECVDDRVDGRVGVHHVVGEREEDVVTLQGGFKDSMKEEEL